MRSEILMALVLACGTAHASDWVSVGKSGDGATEGLVDVSTIGITDGIRRAWIKMASVHHKSYTVERDAFNCEQFTIRWEAYTMYSEDGRAIPEAQPASFPDLWKPVPPDSMGGALMQFVCAWKPK